MKPINPKSLRGRREAKGRTQLAMATELGVTVEAIRGWERGDHFPQRRLWERVAKGYGISTSELASAFVGGATKKPAPVA
jgi:transcriptional regulator with XRE-family HTH domain